MQKLKNNNMQKKYTFFLEWDEGTFISQYSSNSLVESIKSWSMSLDLISIGALSGSKENFLKEIEDETPIAIENVDSVWCITAFIEERLATIYIVETS
ncbi:MAG: hypothetical protein ACRBHB_09885 [Arenicella sp.]